LIFVTIGNTTQGFRRLLEAVDLLAGKGMLGDEKIFLQTGSTLNVRPSYCEHKPFLPMDEFQQWVEKADLIICHGGCGTLLQTLQLGKVPVVMPRRKKYGEHVNDHQVQLVEALASEGRIIRAYDQEDLPEAIAEARRRNSQPVPQPPSQMLELVAKAIEELMRRKR
jgi:UDP-N-acetylglucosamine transferase subunit ALG13